MSDSALQTRKRDPVADWKAFRPEQIPTKGGSLEKMPALFLETLATLEGTIGSADGSENASSARTTGTGTTTNPIRKKQLHYPEYLSILELGCGCGELSSSLQLRGHSVHGIDVNEAAIDTARALAATNLRTQTRADSNDSNAAIDDPAVHPSTTARSSVLGTATFEVADIASAPTKAQEEHEHQQPIPKYDFCVLQLLLSVVGGHDRQRQALRTAYDSLKPGGSLYLSCSGVSDSINPNYQRLYQRDASDLADDQGQHGGDKGGGGHSYYSRDPTTDAILYVTHHFTLAELEFLLSDAGFGEIRIEQQREASSRRPEEQAYFLYATAVAKGNT